jgi:hypothetical protein
MFSPRILQSWEREFETVINFILKVDLSNASFLRCAEPLAVPQLKWLGVHPSDFQHLDETKMMQLSKVSFLIFILMFLAFAPI